MLDYGSSNLSLFLFGNHCGTQLFLDDSECFQKFRIGGSHCVCAWPRQVLLLSRASQMRADKAAEYARSQDSQQFHALLALVEKTGSRSRSKVVQPKGTVTTVRFEALTSRSIDRKSTRL